MSRISFILWQMSWITVDKEIFDGLLTSMKEAVAISKGEIEPGRTIHIEPVDVRAIRENAGLSQGELANEDP